MVCQLIIEIEDVMTVRIMCIFTFYMGVKGSVCRANSYPLRPRRVIWIQTKREGVYKLRRSQTGQTQIGLSCKAPKRSDTGTGALGVLITHETSLMHYPLLHHGITRLTCCHSGSSLHND